MASEKSNPPFGRVIVKSNDILGVNLKSLSIHNIPAPDG